MLKKSTSSLRHTLAATCLVSASLAAAVSHANPSEENMRISYFAEQGKPELEGCDTSQYSAMCSAAMLNYIDFLTATEKGESKDKLDALWNTHVENAKAYMQSIAP